MAIAAASTSASTLPSSSASRIPSASAKPFFFSPSPPSSSPQSRLLRTGLPLRNPRFSISSAAASMSVRAPERSSPPSSFLDRRESGFLHFVKYHGLGNDFILVDNRNSSEPRVTPEQAVKLCDRNFGIGADGVIFAMPGINGTDYAMRIFNPMAASLS